MPRRDGTNTVWRRDEPPPLSTVDGHIDDLVHEHRLSSDSSDSSNSHRIRNLGHQTALAWVFHIYVTRPYVTGTLHAPVASLGAAMPLDNDSSDIAGQDSKAL